VFSRNLYTLIVGMAVITTLAMPPMLRWALRRLPLRKGERQRLEREELDARGFVPNLERLLLAVDGSANGAFASRLAGAIAGSGDKPTTIIELGPGKWPRRAAERETEESQNKVRAAAESTVTLAAHRDEQTRGTVEVIARTRKAANAQAVADEAQKGYDLLIVGIEKARGPRGGFSPEMTLLPPQPVATRVSHTQSNTWLCQAKLHSPWRCRSSPSASMTCRPEHFLTIFCRRTIC
jgi:hypothetical protein